MCPSVPQKRILQVQHTSGVEGFRRYEPALWTRKGELLQVNHFATIWKYRRKTCGMRRNKANAKGVRVPTYWVTYCSNR